MFGLPILEVAIGLSFVYLLLALICTTLNETIAGLTARRAGILEKGISSLLGDDPDLKKKFFDHPLIASLGPKNAADDAAALRDGIKTAVKPFLRTSLLAVLAEKTTKLKTDQEKIEAWYDDAMDRVSGWYKRHTHVWIWILAVVITLGL